MSWTYQLETDTLTVRYQRAIGQVIRVVRLDNGSVDLDRNGSTVLITVRWASRFCNPDDLLRIGFPDEPTEHLHTLLDVARELGVTSYDVRQEMLAGLMPAVRRGAVWGIRPYVIPVYRAVRKLLDQALREPT